MAFSPRFIQPAYASCFSCGKYSGDAGLLLLIDFYGGQAMDRVNFASQRIG